eukprot:CAMPEP_0113682672 /NCGR_PEP_ID=MMETSP0038_2-20120614/12810_1 /TAXON_ID=2898 /ORGANISM="Cryptomonas paramecium" /LENGTH=59 /DNA_ID=CAMNT_0000601801 /DNA_START=263 /DNA_END=442 /DNA_ORIENTATION=- /assembly_acc=CAM_ASM_000170
MTQRSYTINNASSFTFGTANGKTDLRAKALNKDYIATKLKSALVPSLTPSRLDTSKARV